MKSPISFSEWFPTSEVGKKAIAEATKAEVGERKVLAAELATIAADIAKAYADSQEVIEKLTAEVLKARAALTVAENALAGPRHALLQIQTQANTRTERIEAELRDGALPAVKKFLEETSGLWDQERREWQWSAPEVDGVKMPARVRSAHIGSIRDQAVALLLEADPVVAERELARLKSELEIPAAAA